MRHITKKELFTIPNLMGYFRILLIPVFIGSYLRAKLPRDYWISAGIIALSGLTDLLDGMIARRFHQVTELGKFLDPLADKLTQGALVFCLASRFPMLWLLAGLFLVKEGYMAVMGLYMLRRYQKKLDGAMWFGKVCTTVLYLVMFLLLFFPSLPAGAANGLILFCAAVMVFTLLLYIPVFRKMAKEG